MVGAPRAPRREFAARTALCACARGRLRSGPRANERVHMRAGVGGWVGMGGRRRIVRARVPATICGVSSGLPG